MTYDVTHTHNAGRVPVTVEAQNLEWDYTADPPALRFTVARVGDGAPLSATVPMSAVVRVVRPDDAPITRICRHCAAPITWDGNYWRDNSEDPGDGHGGDASCGCRPILNSRAQPHEPTTAVEEVALEERSYRMDTIAPTESAAQHARRVERESRGTVGADYFHGAEDIR